MKKQKKIIMQIIIFIAILILSSPVFATTTTEGKIEISEDYLEYLKSIDNTNENTIAPRMYDIPTTSSVVTNPLRLIRMLGTTGIQPYSLKTIIPENMVVKNQMTTNTCWAFSSLASLETNLALKDKNNKLPTIVYDFSERHMDYATSREFLDGTNEWGYNRTAGSGGVIGMSIAYLTNGLGAISEKEMPFDTDIKPINISQIQDKKVISQVNDIVTFPTYSSTDDLTQIKQQMKEHIKNYGAINASVHGTNWEDESNVYNPDTASAYCNSTSYKIDHSVAIVGWDDGYSTENFIKGNRPKNNGAWIAKNSWGEEHGDDGYVYISYEDANIYKQLTGIIDAQTEIDYENIYQYDEFGGYLKFTNDFSKIYLATEFDKKTTSEEYLTQISITAPEKYTCKVYVNPNGTSKSKNDLEPILLKTGESEAFDAGYHTIEFAEPVKINSNKFIVALEIQGTRTDKISTLVELNYGEFFTTNPNAPNHVYDNVTIANSKCFLTTEEGFQANIWDDASKMYELSEGKIPNFDTTIKAFTVSKILESISIEKKTEKTEYIEGQDFDETGMLVKANYSNGDSIEILNYKILNGENLELGQETVTIEYEGKITDQDIDVVENRVESIAIIEKPSTTDYWAGQDFDDTGMVIEATYLDKTTEIITDYIVDDGENLKNSQSTVTIAYKGQTVSQEITVQANPVIKLEITKEPNKKQYVAGQNFNSSGMVVEATYKNGLKKNVTDYVVYDDNNLYEGQTTVTIEYEEKKVTQSITVVSKNVTGITIQAFPNKTEYIQNTEQLDLTGGTIQITYNDGTTEEMPMISKEITIEGFNNKQPGTQTVIIKYEQYLASFKVEIKELSRPENSDFNNVKVRVDGVKKFTDTTKQEYGTFNVELSDIIKATVNDEMEYYYYLSISPNETNITDWIKIEKMQEEANQIIFEINTLDILNYEELVNANTIYLYVKEIATRNDMIEEKTTLALALNVENINDNTTVSGTIPNAGRSILTMIVALSILIIGRIAYYKYKDIEI